MKHKFQIGQTVYNILKDEYATISQKRIENGHICYLLDDDSIVNENKLI